VSAKEAGLTPDEIRIGRQRVEQALKRRALPYYSAEERETLAVLRGELSRRQSAKGKARRAKEVAQVANRRQQVDLLLRYVVDEKYRKKPKSLATVMKIVDWLDGIGIPASETQVRRDIAASLKSEPLSA
jgi:hypothetical protein